MNRIPVDVRINWVPIVFADHNVRLLFASDMGDNGQIDKHKYRKYDHLDVVDELDRNYEKGTIFFEEKLLPPNGIFVNANINRISNSNIVKQYIYNGIEAALVNNSAIYEWNRGKAGLSVVTLESCEEIVKEFVVFHQFNLLAHYFREQKSNKLAYGLVASHNCHYKFNISPDDLQYFLNSNVDFSIDAIRITGQLIDVSSNKAIVKYRHRVDKFRYEVKQIELPKENIQPVGSVVNFYDLVKKKYTKNYGLLDRKRKLFSKDITVTGERNQTLLKEKYELINAFIANLAERNNPFTVGYENATTFKVDHNFIPVEQNEQDKYLINGRRLPKRKFVFNVNKSDTELGQYIGVRSNGAFKYIDNSDKLKYIFIFPKGKNELANTLYFALKNGIASFPGIESLFKMPINKENVSSVVVPDLKHTSYSQSIDDYLKNNIHTLDPSKTLAFIIVPEAPNEFPPNPYYASKAVLFRYGIASQGISYDTIEGANFKWSIANIALAAFAKLGGIPWRIESNSTKKRLVFGIGQKQIYDEETQSLRRIIGFTVCVTPDGQFQSLTTFKPFDSKDAFIKNLRSEVVNAITKAIESSNDVEELIVHFPRRSSGDEIIEIENALREIATKTGKLITYAVLRVIESDSFLLWDLSHPSFIPEEGYACNVSNDDTILCVPGRQEKKSINAISKYPLRITQIRNTLTATSFDQLIYEIYALSGANWRGFNAREMPITIYYSTLVANLIGKLSYYDRDFLSGLKNLEKIPWFL